MEGNPGGGQGPLGAEDCPAQTALKGHQTEGV
jgi:hypothetical protein